MAKLLEIFITQSTRPTGSTANVWVLCRSPSEPLTGPVLGKGQQFSPEFCSRLFGDPAIETFKTGFLDAPLEVLQDYLLRQKHRNIEGAEGERPNPLADGIFAVLDSRSVRDGTVAVYDYHRRAPKEYYDEHDDEEADWDKVTTIKELVEWRVRFLTAECWVNALVGANIYGDFEVGRNMYIDKEGVLQLPLFEHMDFSDLKEEEKVPWGPEKSAEEKEKSAWRFAESPWVDLVEEGVIKVHKAI